jgi:ABC-2 type transport system permease protein
MSAALTLGAFVRRDWAIVRSYRAAFVMDAFGIVFVLAMAFYVARLVDGSELTAKAGVPGGYFAFATVGIALIRMVQTGLSAFSQRLRTEQMTGTLETLMVAPVSPSLVVIASGAYGLLRAMITGTLTIVVAVVIFGLHLNASPDSLAAGAGALVACLALFTSMGVAVAAFTILFRQTATALGFVLALLGLIGGAYFPISVLPGPLHALAVANPFTWGLDTLRQAVLAGHVELGKLGLLVVFDVLLLPAALLLFGMAVNRARLNGTLSHY